MMRKMKSIHGKRISGQKEGVPKIEYKVRWEKGKRKKAWPDEWVEAERLTQSIDLIKDFEKILQRKEEEEKKKQLIEKQKRSEALSVERRAGEIYKQLLADGVPKTTAWDSAYAQACQEGGRKRKHKNISVES